MGQGEGTDIPLPKVPRMHVGEGRRIWGNRQRQGGGNGGITGGAAGRMGNTPGAVKRGGGSPVEHGGGPRVQKSPVGAGAMPGLQLPRL